MGSPLHRRHLSYFRNTSAVDIDKRRYSSSQSRPPRASQQPKPRETTALFLPCHSFPLPPPPIHPFRQLLLHPRAFSVHSRYRTQAQPPRAKQAYRRHSPHPVLFFFGGFQRLRETCSVPPLESSPARFLCPPPTRTWRAPLTRRPESTAPTFARFLQMFSSWMNVVKRFGRCRAIGQGARGNARGRRGTVGVGARLFICCAR